MPPKRILICDDETVMRELVRVVLEDRYEFWEAGGGFECVELAREVNPDLLIVDVMLPGKSGLEVLGELRADPDFACASVMVLTAWNHLERDALRAGADAFVVKPFEPDVLRELVADLLAGREGRSGASPKVSGE
jgi:CheY-like chemotaxis protein